MMNCAYPQWNKVSRPLAETLISICIFYMLKSTRPLLPVTSLGLFLYNPMNKVHFTYEVNGKKTLLNLHRNMQEGASCYLYKKNWMEQPLSHVNQVELDSGNQDLSWRFSSQHRLSVETLFLWHAQTRGSKFVQSQCDDADTGGPFQRKEMWPQLNWNAYPLLAFRRHSKFPESISRFTDLLRSIKTHHINR